MPSTILDSAEAREKLEPRCETEVSSALSTGKLLQAILRVAVQPRQTLCEFLSRRDNGGVYKWAKRLGILPVNVVLAHTVAVVVSRVGWSTAGEIQEKK